MIKMGFVITKESQDDIGCNCGKSRAQVEALPKTNLTRLQTAILKGSQDYTNSVQIGAEE